MTCNRTENLVGALALMLSDRIVKAADQLVPRGEPAAAIAIVGRSPGWTIRMLSTDLGLSHAATVRLVDRLVADDLMARGRATDDRRAVALSLTETGESTYQAMLESRHECVGEALKALSSDEKDLLGTIAGKLLGGGATQHDRSRICRFCDVESCRSCPIDESLGAGLVRV